MLVILMDEDGEEVIDLDEMKLFGMFRECEPELESIKYGSAKAKGLEDEEA